MGKKLFKKKGEAGEVVKYMSRQKAMKKLQLNKDQFYRLCIHKGIYPIEPKHRIRVQGGSSKWRPLYLKKDVKFMLHDPNIFKYREEDRLHKKIKKAKHMHNVTKETIHKRNKPVVTLQHNVLERYPSFQDALKDLSDSLNMVFLFSMLPAYDPIKEHHVSRAQRLVNEFMTYVIEARCINKAFISTRGYYYEVEINKVQIVFIIPHACNSVIPMSVDLDVMKNFLEFHMSVLGFVNFRLLQQVGYRYPLTPATIPNFKGKEKKDFDNFKNLMASLNHPMQRMTDKEEETKLEIDTKALVNDSNPATQKHYLQVLNKELRRTLFKGQKFFIGRECNRVSLTFVIRACGGQVSWDASSFPCSTFTEDDQTITYQIVDRPNVQKQYLTRNYVQPQFVYDCTNAATLLDCQKYLPDVDLPPHVSPFLRDVENWYVPPEEEVLRNLIAATPEEKNAIISKLREEDVERMRLIQDVKAKQTEAEAEENEKEESEEEAESEAEQGTDKENAEDVEVDMDTEDKILEADEAANAPKSQTRRAKERVVIAELEEQKEKDRELRLRKMMIHKSDKSLYHKLQRKEMKVQKRGTYLKERRQAIEGNKLGLVSQEELDYPKAKAQKKTFMQRKKQMYGKRKRSAVKFAGKEDKRRADSKASSKE